MQAQRSRRFERIARVEKAAAAADEGARRALCGAKWLTSSFRRRSLLDCPSFSTNMAAFNLHGSSYTPINAAIDTSSEWTSLRGAPHSALPNAAGGGFAASPFALPAKRAARRRAFSRVSLSSPIKSVLLPCFSQTFLSRRFAERRYISDIAKAAKLAKIGALRGFQSPRILSHSN